MDPEPKNPDKRQGEGPLPQPRGAGPEWEVTFPWETAASSDQPAAAGPTQLGDWLNLELPPLDSLPAAEASEPEEGKRPDRVTPMVPEPLPLAEPSAPQPFPELILNLTVPELVQLQDIVLFQVRVSNKGSGPATAVHFRNVLPTGLHHDRGSVIEADLGTLNPGKSKLVRFKATAHEAGTQVSAATVSCREGCQARADMTVQVAEPALLLRLSGPQRSPHSDDLLFCIELLNQGTAPAADVRVTLTLPNEVEFHEGSCGSCYDEAGRCLSWELATLPPGQPWAATVQLAVTTTEEISLQAAAHAGRGREVRAKAHFAAGGVETAAEANAGSVVPTAAGNVSPGAEEPPGGDFIEAAVQEPEPEPEDNLEPLAPAEGARLEDLLADMDKEDESTAFPEDELVGGFGEVRPVVQGEAEEQYIVFALAGTDYAVPIGNVVEVGRPRHITPLPNVPDWMTGLTNLRGDVISVVNLRAFLGMDLVPLGNAGRMLVARSTTEDTTTGLLVDRVRQISKLPVRQIAAPTSPLEDRVTPYLRGVAEHAGRLLVVLDLDRLLLSPDMRQFEPV
jgi:purine-binding chemotaxis protein CheW